MNAPSPNLDSAAPPSADHEPRSGSLPSPERGDYSVTFRDEGDFRALYAAQAWLEARGFSFGSPQRGAPIAIMHGRVKIAKWRNLDSEERADLHGMIKSPTFSYREGPVSIVINRYAPGFVLEAFRSDPVDLDARRHVEERT